MRVRHRVGASESARGKDRRVRVRQAVIRDEHRDERVQAGGAREGRVGQRAPRVGGDVHRVVAETLGRRDGRRRR